MIATVQIPTQDAQQKFCVYGRSKCDKCGGRDLWRLEGVLSSRDSAGVAKAFLAHRNPHREYKIFPQTAGRIEALIPA